MLVANSRRPWRYHGCSACGDFRHPGSLSRGRMLSKNIFSPLDVLTSHDLRCVIFQPQHRVMMFYSLAAWMSQEAYSTRFHEMLMWYKSNILAINVLDNQRRRRACKLTTSLPIMISLTVMLLTPDRTLTVKTVVPPRSPSWSHTPARVFPLSLENLTPSLRQARDAF